MQRRHLAPAAARHQAAQPARQPLRRQPPGDRRKQRHRVASERHGPDAQAGHDGQRLLPGQRFQPRRDRVGHHLGWGPIQDGALRIGQQVHQQLGPFQAAIIVKNLRLESGVAQQCGGLPDGSSLAHRREPGPEPVAMHLHLAGSRDRSRRVDGARDDPVLAERRGQRFLVADPILQRQEGRQPVCVQRPEFGDHGGGVVGFDGQQGQVVGRRQTRFLGETWFVCAQGECCGNGVDGAHVRGVAAGAGRFQQDQPRRPHGRDQGRPADQGDIMACQCQAGAQQ